MSITIRKALNKKNLLASELSDLRCKIQTNNQVKKTTRITADGIETVTFTSESAKVDVCNLLTKVDAMVDKLVELKTKIHLVNAGAQNVDNWKDTQYYSIVFAEEIKGLISYHESLKNNGPLSTESIDRLTDDKYERKVTTVTWQLDNNMLDSKISQYKIALEACLDDIEEFNASRRIDIDL